MHRVFDTLQEARDYIASNPDLEEPKICMDISGYFITVIDHSVIPTEWNPNPRKAI